jgi:pimeloyl-ACP methyl ester carboxylesterase
MDITLPTGTVHIEDRGRGYPLVILHGGKLDHRHMLETFEPVFETAIGWRRLYVDLPGCGQSQASDAVSSQEDVLDLLLQAIDAVLDSQSFAVIGESRGGYHARGVVYKRPNQVGGMMLIGAGGMEDKSKDRLPEHVTLVRNETLRKGLSSEELARLDRLVVQRSDIVDRIRRTKIPANETADLELENRVLKQFLFSFDLNKPKRSFAKPCLIVAGRQDAISGYWDMIEALEVYPRATLSILDRAGHSLAWEQPTLFSALTIEWLRRVAETVE